LNSKITTKNAMLRYCLIQLLLWTQFCCCTSFAAVFMHGKGVSNAMIGVAFAIGNLLAFISQPMLSSVADRGKKITVTQMAILMYAAMFSLEAITLVAGLPVIVVTLIYALIFMIIQNTPVIANGLGIYYMDRGASINYGVSRGLGSISYSCLSLILGELVTVTSYRTVAYAQLILAVLTIIALRLMPTPRNVLSSKMAAAADIESVSTGSSAADIESVPTGSSVADTESVPEVLEEKISEDTSYLAFIKKNRSFMMYFLGMGMIMILYNFYNNFTINIVKSVGAGSEEMGMLLAIAGIAEVPAMFAFDHLARKIEVKHLMIVSALGFAVRGSLMTFAGGVAGLYAASVMQFMGFALFMPGMVKLSDKYFGEGDKNKAQGLLQSTMSFGAIIGSMVGGPLIDIIGVRSVMVVMLAVSVVGTVIAILALEKFCGKNKLAKTEIE
jgi:PPP family 3-phenylpropionic acid transporter